MKDGKCVYVIEFIKKLTRVRFSSILLYCTGVDSYLLQLKDMQWFRTMGQGITSMSFYFNNSPNYPGIPMIMSGYSN